MTTASLTDERREITVPVTDLRVGDIYRGRVDLRVYDVKEDKTRHNVVSVLAQAGPNSKFRNLFLRADATVTVLRSPGWSDAR